MIGQKYRGYKELQLNKSTVLTKLYKKWNDCMSILINIGTSLTGFALIAIIFYLMVNKKMSEAQSVLWIIIGVVTIIIGIFPSVISFVANKLGVWYAPSITFLVAYIGLLFIVLKNTVIISIQSNQINEIFMSVILLKRENEELKQELKSIKEEAE